MVIHSSNKFLFSSSYICNSSSKQFFPIFLSTVFFIFLGIGSFNILAEGFVLQELPLYRSIRDTEIKATPLILVKSPTNLFERKTRAFNFKRLNKLRNFWQRNEALRMALFPEQKFIFESY